MIDPTTHNKAISDTIAEPSNATNPNANFQNITNDASIAVPLSVPSETKNPYNSLPKLSGEHQAEPPKFLPIQLTESRSTSSIDTFYSAVWHQPKSVFVSPKTSMARDITNRFYRTKPITIDTSHLPPPPRFSPSVRQTSPRIKIRFTACDADVCIAEVLTQQRCLRRA